MLYRVAGGDEAFPVSPPLTETVSLPPPSSSGLTQRVAAASASYNTRSRRSVAMVFQKTSNERVEVANVLVDLASKGIVGQKRNADQVNRVGDDSVRKTKVSGRDTALARVKRHPVLIILMIRPACVWVPTEQAYRQVQGGSDCSPWVLFMTSGPPDL